MEDYSKAELALMLRCKKYMEKIIQRRIRNVVIKYLRDSKRNGGTSLEGLYGEVLNEDIPVYDEYKFEEEEEDILEVSIKDMTLRVNSRALFEALSSLAPREFESVYWGVAENYNDKELARKMGYKDDRVAASKKSQAVRKMKKEMGVEEDGDKNANEAGGVDPV